mmetsp:Transcript_34414/g.90558  ORF Transcript_34414/g.90558 Transcript_34414/m.90558 type:complete len:224 (-) Transcript_34414:328-999(-)
MQNGGSSSDAMAALPAPHIDVDALPYVDSQYNDPAMKRQVDALIQEEMRTFRPSKDYLAPWPLHEPTFDDHPLLQVEWMRVCERQPMPKMDTSRYQLDPPPPDQQSDPAAWQRAVDNAQAQLEHQSTRIGNLELLQQHGAHLWRAHLSTLDGATSQMSRAEADLAAQIELVNRKRKADQLAAGPRLVALEAEWVGAVKKNLEIEAQCLHLEAECAELREAKKR